MEVLILQVFVSLLLVSGSILLFSYSVRQCDYEQSDRLALHALSRDDAAGTATATDTAKEQP